MPQTATEHEGPTYDVVGVGFGPSNLALAIATTEHNAQCADDERVNAAFLERRPQFAWHPGMLIDDATMQVSFLKDLVTMRNPASEFSFLSYLHSLGRLVDFINHKSLFPLRVEFHDYFEWAAQKLDGLVRYQREVTTVHPVTRGGNVVAFDVVARGADLDEPVTYRARNVVFGLGLEPHLPEGVAQRDRIWHNSQLLHRIDELGDLCPQRLAVVGSGQSAAETTAHLHRIFPESEICSVFSRYGYSPSDDSPFANQVFDPDAVDAYFTAPESVKQMILGYHGNTNYSVVDLDLIEDLYGRLYKEKVLGKQRLRFYHLSRLREVTETASGVRLTVESLSTGEETTLDSDVVVYATGYRPVDPLPLLGNQAHDCYKDERGRPRVERDYRVVTAPHVQPGVYLQGGTEHTHGITSSLLSNGAVRSGEILRSILDRRARTGFAERNYAITRSA